MRKVLIVSHHFLPVHNVGVKQFLGYCKYLPDFGWQPVVLTHDWREPIPKDQSWWGLSFEPDLLGEAERRIKICRTTADLNPTPFMRGHAFLARRTEPSIPILKRWAWTLPRKVFSLAYPFLGPFPDGCGRWVQPAVRLGVEVCGSEGIQALLSNCPPETNHRVAYHIAGRTDLPWAPYFGDLYGFFIDEQDFHGVWWKRRVAYKIRKRWMGRARHALGVSPYMVDYLKRFYRVEGDVVVVGFDEQDFGGRAGKPGGNRFLISHIGSVYPGDEKPELLFEAVSRLARKRPEWMADWSIRFVGSKCEAQLRQMAGKLPGGSPYAFLPKVSAAEAIRMQKESSVLLLLNPTHARKTHGTMSYPSKLFEYLAAGKPILAVPGDGDWVEQVLTTTGAGVSASSVEAVEGKLMEWYSAWRAGGQVPYTGNREEILKFSHRSQARRMAAVLDRIAGRPG